MSEREPGQCQATREPPQLRLHVFYAQLSHLNSVKYENRVEQGELSLPTPQDFPRVEHPSSLLNSLLTSRPALRAPCTVLPCCTNLKRARRLASEAVVAQRPDCSRTMNEQPHGVQLTQFTGRSLAQDIVRACLATLWPFIGVPARKCLDVQSRFWYAMHPPHCTGPQSSPFILNFADASHPNDMHGASPHVAGYN